MISELPEISGKNGGKTKQACFLCNGTGRREVAEKFVYGDNAINEEKKLKLQIYYTEQDN